MFVVLQRSDKISNVTCKVSVLGSFWDGIAGLGGSLGSILELWEVILELRMVSFWDPGVFLEHFGTRSVKERVLLNCTYTFGSILGGFWARFGVLLDAKSHQKMSKIDAKNLSIFQTQLLMVFYEFWSVGSSKIDKKPLFFMSDREVHDFVTSPTSGSNIDRFWTSKVIRIGALELKISVQNRWEF